MSSAWNSLEFAITGGHCVYELTDIVRTCVWRNIFLQNVLQGSHWEKRIDKLKKRRGGIRFGNILPPSLTFFGREKVCRSLKMITDFFIEYLGIFAYVMCSWFDDWFQYVLFYRKCVISCAVSFDAVTRDHGLDANIFSRSAAQWTVRNKSVTTLMFVSLQILIWIVWMGLLFSRDRTTPFIGVLHLEYRVGWRIIFDANYLILDTLRWSRNRRSDKRKISNLCGTSYRQ